MKISKLIVRKPNLVEPIAIQLKSSGFIPGEKISEQQDRVSQILTELGIIYSRCGNNISVNRVDYLWLKQKNLVAPAIYQRSRLELDQPVLVYILKKNSTNENDLLEAERVISRLEEIGIFYALPKEESLSLYLLIEKDSVAKFRKEIRRRYNQSVGVFFPSVRQ